MRERLRERLRVGIEMWAGSGVVEGHEQCMHADKTAREIDRRTD